MSFPYDIVHMRSYIQGWYHPPFRLLTRFSSHEEALRLANDSDLALTSSVFSRNTKVARDLAVRIEAGVTTINDHLYTHGMSETPWGGWKCSGLGRTHGYLGLKEMTNAKLVNSDLLPTPRNIWFYPFDRLHLSFVP
eukprot:NODE_3418_length_931_cov_15.672336_g2846_i0.p1 GENE.NODE_3418_length_931_cov_15.672336_g2846_i0~~NODE_3418_length_931_cov_15.672336_g2846_i0.p1  ORF type:complete len:137 (+),score=10.38 NODE_3418_length_931_cov_15.672336_g2846_i0:247-657(+)